MLFLESKFMIFFEVEGRMNEWSEFHLRHDHHNRRFQQMAVAEMLTSVTPAASSESFMTSNSQVPNFNFSSDEVKDLEQLRPRNGSSEGVDAVYTMVAVPVMSLFCLITIVVNLVIVASARWCRKPMSPTLYFSISLALADAYSTLLVGIGLVLNSFLPKVYHIHIASDCFNLIFEAFR